MRLFIRHLTGNVNQPTQLDEINLSDAKGIIIQLSDDTAFEVWKPSILDLDNGLRICCRDDKMMLIQVEANNSIKLREV